MMGTINSSDCINQSSQLDESTSTLKSLESQVCELKLQLESLSVKYKKNLAEIKTTNQHLKRLQEEVELYFLISEKQKNIIESLEKLQAKSTEIICNQAMK